MYQRILVPLDGSPLAEQVLPYAKHLAKEHHLGIELLRMIEPLSVAVAPGYGTPTADIVTGVKIQAQDYLEEMKARLNSTGFQAEYSVLEGDPAQGIVDHADAEPGTFIAMSTHGRSGIGRWVMGSVADKVLHAASCPVLLVRASEDQAPPADTSVDSIIVPLDGSELAEKILPHVVDFGRTNGPGRRTKVVLAWVTSASEEISTYMTQRRIDAAATYMNERHIDPAAYINKRHLDAASTVYEGPYEEYLRGEQAFAAGYLHSISSQLAEEGIMVEDQLLRGHPAVAISEFANSEPNQMIMMTTRGRSGLGRWLLGSVADKVVRMSGVPVFLVHADLDKEAKK